VATCRRSDGGNPQTTRFVRFPPQPNQASLPPDASATPTHLTLVTNFFPFDILTSLPAPCHNPAMNAASATVSARAAPPVLTRAWARVSATLSAFAVLVALVANLIEQGKHLAATIRAHAADCGYGQTGGFLETGDIHVIGTCIRRGVMRRMALYKALWHQANGRFGSRLPALPCDRTPPAPGGAKARAGTAAAQHNAPATAAHPERRQNCDPSYLPTDEPAADEASRRAARAIPPRVSPHFANTPEAAGILRDGPLLVPFASLGFRFTQFIAEVDRCQAPASRIETPRLGRGPEHQRPNCLSAVEQLRDVPPPQAASAECSSPEAKPRPGTFEQTETAPAMLRPVSPCPAQEVAATTSH